MGKDAKKRGREKWEMFEKKKKKFCEKKRSLCEKKGSLGKKYKQHQRFSNFKNITLPLIYSQTVLRVQYFLYVQ